MRPNGTALPNYLTYPIVSSGVLEAMQRIRQHTENDVGLPETTIAVHQVASLHTGNNCHRPCDDAYGALCLYPHRVLDEKPRCIQGTKSKDERQSIRGTGLIN